MNFILDFNTVMQGVVTGLGIIFIFLIKRFYIRIMKSQELLSIKVDSFMYAMEQMNGDFSPRFKEAYAERYDQLMKENEFLNK